MACFFKREVNLTYRRLQDIHLTHNLLQRWMGLATISLQTASGNAGAEMSIEGVLEAEQLRDFLYARMRGAKDDQRTIQPVHSVAGDGIVTASLYDPDAAPAFWRRLSIFATPCRSWWIAVECAHDR